jgi:hypothetical protein
MTICKIRKALVVVVVDPDDILHWFVAIVGDFLDDLDLKDQV